MPDPSVVGVAPRRWLGVVSVVAAFSAHSLKATKRRAGFGGCAEQQLEHVRPTSWLWLGRRFAAVHLLELDRWEVMVRWLGLRARATFRPHALAGLHAA